MKQISAEAQAVMNGWDQMSESYQSQSHISLADVHYSPFGFGENQLKLIGDIRGKRFVELGCGGSQNSIAVASQGAECVVGIDISGNQLRCAKIIGKQTGQHIDLIQANIEQLGFLKSSSFDVVMTMFALEFIVDAQLFFKTCHRLLHKGGILVLSTVHPLSGFEWDETSNGLLVNDYLNPPVEVWGQSNKVAAPGAMTIFRTIEEIVTTILKAGFEIRSLLEPGVLPRDSLNESPYRGQYWDPFLERFEKLPFAIVIKAVKTG